MAHNFCAPDFCSYINLLNLPANQGGEFLHPLTVQNFCIAGFVHISLKLPAYWGAEFLRLLLLVSLLLYLAKDKVCRISASRKVRRISASRKVRRISASPKVRRI